MPATAVAPGVHVAFDRSEPRSRARRGARARLPKRAFVHARTFAVSVSIVLAACAGVSPAPAPLPVPSAHPGGNLFSTIPCAETALGREWARLLPEATARFPGLRLTMVEDLHVTVVYVGPGWKVEDLDRIRELALVSPRETVTFRPEAVRLGRNAHVVAVEMHDAPEAWLAAVVAAKAEMNRLGLKKPEGLDAAFRPHVTLASARSNPPDAGEAAALDEFRAFIADRVAADPARYAVTAGPETPVRLWLAGTPRPAGAAEYVDLDTALARR